MAEKSSTDTGAGASGQFCQPTKSFTLLSWNIDGLDEEDTIERTQAVCDLILAKKPHAVFLQEVVGFTEIEILKKLGSLYDYYSAPSAVEKYRYFVCILILKAPGLVAKGELMTVDFPNTCMGRHVIKCFIAYCGVEVDLLTSHLESKKEYGQERKQQLSTVFDMISKSSTKNTIFGGDLNLRDNEVKAVGVPPDTVDVWEACGANMKEKFTWDLLANDNLDWPYPNRPKSRYDRVYLLSRDHYIQAHSFCLVGKERLPSCGRFPSDHWGLWMEFNVQGAEEPVIID